MLRLALETMRARRHGFVGAFVALSFAVALVTACGILMETGMRAAAPVQRYAAVPVVVAANQTIAVTLDGATSPSSPSCCRSGPGSRRRWRSGVADVDGVQTVIADRSIPTTVATADGQLLSGPDGGPVVGHGWSSAALTPYSLAAGRAPSTPGEVVLDATLAAQERPRGRRPGAVSPPPTAPAATRSSASPTRHRAAAGRGRSSSPTRWPRACPPTRRGSTRSGCSSRMARTPSRWPTDPADARRAGRHVHRRRPRQRGVPCDHAAQRGAHLARWSLRRVRGAAGRLRRRRHARAVGAAARPGAGAAPRRSAPSPARSGGCCSGRPPSSRWPPAWWDCCPARCSGRSSSTSSRAEASAPRRQAW